MLRTRVLCVVALLIMSRPVAAQSGSIVGAVTAAETGQPVADVQIRVLGTSLGARTRDDGSYTIVVPAGTYTLRAMRIGYVPDSLAGVVVSAGAPTTADFQLTSSATLLRAVVSVGYGEQRARDLTGVVDQVTTEEFNTGRVVSPEELIQAKVAGVQVVDNAEPGGGVSIRIRGGTSVGSSNEPLFVIDGIPIAVGGGLSAGRNPLSFINPNDIESMTVLKDASATAIYGSRGANGVVMVTTKTGKGGPQLSYTGTVSGSQVTGQPNLLNADQLRAAVAAEAPNRVSLLGNANTDWRDAVQRDAGGREHAFALAGSADDMRYRLSMGLLDQDGVVLGTALKRISASLNFSDGLFENRLTMRALLTGARTDDWFTPGGVLGSATAFAPTQPIVTDSGYYEFPTTLSRFFPNNPLAELAQVSDRGTTFRSIGKLEGEYRLPFLERVSVTSRLGYDVAKSERTYFAPSTLRGEVESSQLGTISRNNPTQVNTLLDLFGTYRQDLSRLSSDFDMTAGYSFEESRGDYPSFYAQGLSSDLLGPFGVPTATLREPSLFVDESRLIGFFGRVNYTLKDRYLATLSVRRDGSSKFGLSEQWGTFPSAAFAWRLSEEAWVKSVPRLSELKLRYSWGVNGNQSFGNYQQYSSYTIGGGQAQAQFGNEFVSTIRPSGADQGIKWEETRSTNVGLDYGFFQQRLSGSIDTYTKTTTDLLFYVPVAAGTNLSNFVTTNIGSVRNKGLELSLRALMLTGVKSGFTWDASFNASTNRNELLQINAGSGGSEQILVGGIAGGVGSNIQVLTPGQPVNTFFVYQHKRDAQGRPIYADSNGDSVITDIDLYQDLNGDTVITQADRRAYKSPAPKWIFGHTSAMGYRNFDMGFTIRAYRGNYVYNNVASNMGHYGALRDVALTNLHSSVLQNRFQSPQFFSDVYIEDASFIRMDNISFGYTFQRLRAGSRVRLFGVVQNVFTITDYTGVDPMSGINGIDNNIYPRSRTMTAGLNVAF